jgi:hypothetical protein
MMHRLTAEHRANGSIPAQGFDALMPDALLK